MFVFSFSCGKELTGCRTLIHQPDGDGNGEICFSGRHIFMGYLNMEEKTKEAIDEGGWLHSGDLGKHDKDGFLYITGRIKGNLSPPFVVSRPRSAGTMCPDQVTWLWLTQRNI